MKSSTSRLAWAITLVMASSGSCAQQPFDILIRDATVIDGTGAPRFVADVGIRNDVIALIGEAGDAKAGRTLDGTGLVVAPGFIDAHNHSDVAIAAPNRKWNEGFIRQGVTTIVGGPDGGHSPARLRELIADYQKNGIGTNVAFYVGHNGIRREVMGPDQRRAPSADELATMKRLVREGMELGAVGLSTGLMYEPGMFSETEEVIALAREVEPFGGVYDSHVRNPVHEWLESNREAVEIGASAGIPAKLGHLKEVGLQNAGLTEKLIALVQEARREGRAVVSDQYPYDGAGGRLTLEGILVVSGNRTENQALKRAPGFDLRGKLGDPAERARIRVMSEDGVDGGFAWLKAVGYSGLKITSSPDYPELVGRFLSEIAEERALESFDLIAELILGAESPVEIKGGIQEESIEAIMKQPWTMIASDGFYIDGQSSQQGHPRSTGTFPRVLGVYARERQVITLEEAVRKMTSFPAYFSGLSDRGRLKEGAPADLTVFDPLTVIDKSTYDQPNLFPEGIHHVIVNGQFVLLDGEPTRTAPGRFLPRDPPSP